MSIVIAPLGGLAARSLYEPPGEMAILAVAIEADEADSAVDLSRATSYLCVRQDGASFWLSAKFVRFLRPTPTTSENPQDESLRDALSVEQAAVSEAGEALFSLAFAGAGREHSDHGAEPFSSLTTCSDVICRSRAEVLLAAVAEGIATLRPDDEWLVADSKDTK
jgi:hypothetical protein